MSEITDQQIMRAETLLNSLLGHEVRKPGAAANLPAVIRVVERLEPAGGMAVPVFPPSYLGDGDKPTYDLNGVEYGDPLETIRTKDRERVVRPMLKAKQCAIDAPQSQANRMEPAFIEDADLVKLVPQGTVTAPRAPEKVDSEHVLQLPHRIADFRVRLSNQADAITSAIHKFSKGDALDLLRLMPTSLVFGFWDSRASQTKHARMLLARIDAFDVIPCNRHAVYCGPYSKDEFAAVVLDSPERGKVEKDTKKMAEQGYSNALSDGLGGVLVLGRIERLALLSLTDIARVRCHDKTPEQSAMLTNAARRYIFALSALAEGFQRSTGSYRLRSGCELVSTAENPIIIELRGNGVEAFEDIKSLYRDRAVLIRVAERARDTLSIPMQLEAFTVSKESLRADFGDLQAKSTVTAAAPASPEPSKASKSRKK